MFLAYLNSTEVLPWDLMQLASGDGDTAWHALAVIIYWILIARQPSRNVCQLREEGCVLVASGTLKRFFHGSVAITDRGRENPRAIRSCLGGRLLEALKKRRRMSAGKFRQSHVRIIQIVSMPPRTT